MWRASFFQRFPERGVGGHPAGGHQCWRGSTVRMCEHLEAMPTSIRHGIANGGLKRSRKVRDVLRAGRGSEFERGLADGGLQAGKRKVTTRAALERARQLESGCITLLGGVLDCGATGKPEPEKFCGFVEGFSDRIVDRGAEQRVLAKSLDREQLAMAARHKQQEVGKLNAVGQACCQGVCFEMIDRHEGKGARRCNGLGRHAADMNAADQSGSGRGRNAINGIKRHPGVVERTGDDGIKMIEMRTCSDFGNHAPEGSVIIKLAEHDVRYNRAAAMRVVRDNRSSSFVTARFDSK